MRKHRLVTRDFLRIFDLVSTRGINTEGVRELSGIRAWHDYDGYTCWLSYKDLDVTLMFHGNLEVRCEHDDTMNEFYALCESMSLVDSSAE
ncbi:DUF3081 family protein [Vibrio amylolyticus]|uniref:DUF3081 family protein n=1 Tax=Vibrio amylolyticus TaxID=2847292 RepID=UPI00354FBB48